MERHSEEVCPGGGDFVRRLALGVHRLALGPMPGRRCGQSVQVGPFRKDGTPGRSR
jgi:hypothetical protein